MYGARKSAFTLIELLVVIAVIAILAALLFPIFAQARDRARLAACISNMRQIGHSMMMYVQDYDETFPYIHFRGLTPSGGIDKGKPSYVWKNAIAPYLKSIDVLACPSNPFSRSIPGTPATIPPKPGSNAMGWEAEPGQRMPISYAMNSCATTWYPADSKGGQASGPLRQAQLLRPADTILIAETQWPHAAIDASGLPNPGLCAGMFTHPAGRVADFIFCDGHARSKKWLATLYPVSENNWELSPNPDPNNRKIQGPPGCQFTAPPGPDASVFTTGVCSVNQ